MILLGKGHSPLDPDKGEKRRRILNFSPVYEAIMRVEMIFGNQITSTFVTFMARAGHLIIGAPRVILLDASD